MLAAYAKHAPEVGYCQGMNYLVGLILIGVDMDEVSAFLILERLLGQHGQLGSLYAGQLTKLFDMSDHIYTWMLETEPELEQLISSHGVPLTTLLAGPFMAIFANILSIDTCLLVLDRLMLYKEGALIDIIKNVFVEMKPTLLRQFGQPRNEMDHRHKEDKSGSLQAYLVRLIYIEAEQSYLLFPKLRT